MPHSPLADNNFFDPQGAITDLAQSTDDLVNARYGIKWRHELGWTLPSEVLIKCTTIAIQRYSLPLIATDCHGLPLMPT